MSLFIGRLIEARQTPEGREGTVSLRGALRAIALDAVPEAGVGDAVLVEAGAAVAVVRGGEMPSTEEEHTSCA
ncbi:MAG TPA: HypC/HybG/HupF family hydrogenase formation chaperone [Candidatus Baltobacteraceae bacterium]|nr:HypC/HybG/HupF family hydrogenase formation chaperone [Candidatus Baltobacteraceae bacterium]